MKNNSLITLLALLIGSTWGLRAQNSELAPVTRTFALTNVNIVPQPGEVIEMGTIVVKDGLIHTVGKNVKIPANAKVLDVDSMFVYAGFIEALSHTGIPRPEADDNQGGRRSRPQGVIPGQPTNEQAGITPEVKASSVLSVKEKSIAEMRQMGFTAAHVVPEGRMLPGQGAIILLSGDDANEMVLRDQTALFSQLATARGVYPTTVIGVMSKWRELYKQAQQAQAHETLYQLDPKGMTRPDYDPALQAFYPVLDGKLPVFFVANEIKDIHRVLKLKQELAFPLVLAEVQEGWHAADQLKSMNIPVLLSLDLPDEPKKDDKKKEEGKEEEAKEMTLAEQEQEMLEKRRAETMAQYLKQAAVMAEKGIAFGFSTLEVKSGDIKTNLRRMIENGLPEEQALAALTTVPAKMLGLSNMMGTVEAGKIANLVVSTAPYFDEDANVRYVFVDGTLYEYEVKKKKKAAAGDAAVAANPVGAWRYEVDVPGQEAAGTITITQDGGSYAGQMSSNQGGPALTLSNILLDGNTMTFSATMDGGGQTMNLSFEVVISGDTFEGTVSVGSFGTFDVEGERTSGPN